jgi:hypothetical protein
VSIAASLHTPAAACKRKLVCRLPSTQHTSDLLQNTIAEVFNNSTATLAIHSAILSLCSVALEAIDPCSHESRTTFSAMALGKPANLLGSF